MKHLMMKRALLPMLAMLWLAPLAHGQGAPVSETTPLSNIVAQGVPMFIKTAGGLDQLTINFHDNSVTARGSQAAVAAFEKELRAADVPRVQYQMVMRLVRYRVDSQGKYAETSVQMLPTITTTDGVPATIAINLAGQDGYAMLVTPEPGGDKAVTVTAQVQELGEQGEVISAGRNVLRVPFGKATRITGLTGAADRVLRRAVQQGEVVTDRGAYTGCYVEVTPTIANPPGARHS